MALPALTRRCRREKALATLHLTCGLPCAGKTTLAKRLEHETGGLRLTTDEWLKRIFGEALTVEEANKVRENFEARLLDLTIELLERGVDVVLDFGVWSREERETFRARAAAVGARSELHFLDVPVEELVRRLHERNSDLPAGTFRITEEQLREYATWLQPPTPDELPPREAPAAS
jgi:predicted kinase